MESPAQIRNRPIKISIISTKNEFTYLQHGAGYYLKI
jgi:hypothetical protein